jgi:hypothetical protein
MFTSDYALLVIILQWSSTLLGVGVEDDSVRDPTNVVLTCIITLTDQSSMYPHGNTFFH